MNHRAPVAGADAHTLRQSMTLPAVPSGFPADPPPTLGPGDSDWATSTHLPPDPVLPGARLVDAPLTDQLLQLQRLQGPQSLRGLILALIQTPTSAREAQAWREETQALADGQALHDKVHQLPDDARLPLLEWALHQYVPTDLQQRAELLRSARRVMCADGRVRPIDRLRWLLMRHILSGNARPQAVTMPRARAELALADLPESKRQAIARFTAYLARMVPLSDPIAKVGTAGVAWYRAVTRSFWFEGAPPCQVPDGDQLAHALAELQRLSWMQRPVLVRTWSQAALKVTERLWRGEPLALDAAEALRMAACLLDSPAPGAVTERFVALPSEAAPPH